LRTGREINFDVLVDSHSGPRKRPGMGCAGAYSRRKSGNLADSGRGYVRESPVEAPGSVATVAAALARRTFHHHARRRTCRATTTSVARPVVTGHGHEPGH
jgi:hypothetical protein